MRPTKLQNKAELKARIMVAFTPLNKKIVEKAGRRFPSCLEPAVEANGDFLKINLIYSI